MNQLSNSSIEVIVILGPTATGKTRLAVQLADQMRGEIISADSRQVYRGMNIGTGKDLDEYIINGNKTPYHLIDIVEPMEEYNVAQFQEDCHRVISEIKNRDKLPIICGGTGFYIKSVLMGFEFPMIGPDNKLRQELAYWTLEDLKLKLKNISPKAYANNPLDTRRRLIRAIEIEINRGKVKDIRNKAKRKVQNPLVVGMEYPRRVIRERITARLNDRLKNGMIEEIENLLQNGVTHDRLKSFGLEYRFISEFIQGDITKSEMTAQLNTAIHRFAKKQMTFIRNMEKNGIQIHWISEGNINEVLNVIDKRILLL